MGAPIMMSLLIAILAAQEPRKWSEVSLSSLQSGHKGCDQSFMIVRCLLRETCPVSSPVSRRRSCLTQDDKLNFGQKILEIFYHRQASVLTISIH